MSQVASSEVETSLYRAVQNLPILSWLLKLREGLILIPACLVGSSVDTTSTRA